MTKSNSIFNLKFLAPLVFLSFLSGNLVGYWLGAKLKSHTTFSSRIRIVFVQLFIYCQSYQQVNFLCNLNYKFGRTVLCPGQMWYNSSSQQCTPRRSVVHYLPNSVFNWIYQFWWKKATQLQLKTIDPVPSSVINMLKNYSSSFFDYAFGYTAVFLAANNRFDLLYLNLRLKCDSLTVFGIKVIECTEFDIQFEWMNQFHYMGTS